MYIIRLQKKKRIKINTPAYQVVLINNKRSVQSQKIIKKIGSFSYHNNKIIINITQLVYWIQKGAKLSYKLFKLLNNSSNFFSKQEKKIIQKIC